MRCEYCPLSSAEDVCPEAEGKYGIEFKDGALGCKHPRSWVDKRDKEYADYLGEMGFGMGIEMDFTKSEIEQITDLCKHAVGLDRENPYHRHGKAFYKPYRNYFCTYKDDVLWDRLSKLGIAARSEERNGVVDFYLTRIGLDWLGRQLKITIRGTGEYK